ncbi:MAG: hypothetical protein KBD63_04720, partial [Bacteriovoracaceae bacterium]|nr:hypothetical protein [Bacteriovoracaceae bacterium]
LLQDISREVERAKRIHEQVVPIRYSAIKGMDVYSKYAVGESVGGEFLDVFPLENKILITLSSSSTYSGTSLLLSYLPQFKEKKDLTPQKITDFVSALTLEYKKIAPALLEEKKTNSFQLFLAVLDAKDLSLEGFKFGGQHLISEKKLLLGENELFFMQENIQRSHFRLLLNPSEKLALVSSGLRANTKDIMGEKDLISFIKDHLAQESSDFINEVFFRLKKGRESDFLTFDASLIKIEVGSNVLFQV